MPFAPGQSGNPSGRPKENGHVKELARAHTEAAIKALADILTDPEAPHAARATAANSLLDRAWGKPVQQVTGEDGGPLIGNVTITFVKPEAPSEARSLA